MASIKPILFALTLSCFIVLNLCLLKGHDKEERDVLDENQEKCTPGKFYRKGCRRCFCDENGRVVCTPKKNCKLAGTLPSSPDFIKTYSQKSLQTLKALPHQAAHCNPGGTYRVDCNTCLCLANRNLMCNDLLCPSWEEVNRIKAQTMTGKPCGGVKKEDEQTMCIDCTCSQQTTALKCKPIPDCVPIEFRRHENDISPIDLFKDVSPQGGRCISGMVYKRDCNRCYCHKNYSLSCTLMHCLKHTEVERLKKLRLKLEEEEN